LVGGPYKKKKKISSGLEPYLARALLLLFLLLENLALTATLLSDSSVVFVSNFRIKPH
jgi:hypothetical protein